MLNGPSLKDHHLLIDNFVLVRKTLIVSVELWHLFNLVDCLVFGQIHDFTYPY